MWKGRLMWRHCCAGRKTPASRSAGHSRAGHGATYTLTSQSRPEW